MDRQENHAADSLGELLRLPGWRVHTAHEGRTDLDAAVTARGA